MHTKHPLERIPSLAPYGFAIPMVVARLAHVSPIDPHGVNYQRLIAKFWERRHRSDVADPLPIETIIHRILPRISRKARVRKGDFEFRGLPYRSDDIIFLSTAVYWFGSGCGIEFIERRPNLFSQRPVYPSQEFLKKFNDDNRGEYTLAGWAHRCSEKCRKPRVTLLGTETSCYIDSADIQHRERLLAQALLTWLGTREGRRFLAAWQIRKNMAGRISSKFRAYAFRKQTTRAA